MAFKPILDVEVNDAEFTRFLEKFDAYAADVDAMPEAWRKIGEAMGESSKGLDAGALTAKDALALAAAQAGVIAEAIVEATKAQKDLEGATHATNTRMSSLAKSAQSVGKAIEFVGGWIIKLGAIGGLGALFSGFGIGELASAAFSRTRAAGQLGISPGQLASFQVNAQPFLTTSALEGAANAQIDANKAGYLKTLGISYASALGMSTPDLAFEMLKAARAAYLKNPAFAMQMPAIIAYTQQLGGNIGDVRNAAQYQLSDITAAQTATRNETSLMELSPRVRAEWTQLYKTLQRAGVVIQTALIDRLAPLAPQISVLAGDLADFIRTFVNSKDFGIAVRDTRDGLKALAGFLQQVNWKKIGSEITWLADKLGWLLPKQQTPEKPHPETLREMLWDKDDWADWIAKGVKQFGGDFKKEMSQSALGQAYEWIKDSYFAPTTGFGAPVNNPLDIRGKNGFRQYANTALGIKDAASLLAWYPKGFGADTIAKIIPHWAPAADHNNPAAYIANVEKWSGVNRNLPMSDWSKAQFAAVIAAMSREEGTDRVSISQVIKALYGAEMQKAQQHKTALAHETAPKVRRAAQRTPVHVKVSVTNSTAARLAISMNASSIP